MINRYLVIFAFLSFFIGISACQSEEDILYMRYYTTGQTVYQQRCQNCHGANGEGLGQLYPPLTDTAYLKKNKSSLACVFRHGISDSITINGKEFKASMPGNHHLSDIEIAQVVTYVTNSFGNKQGLYDARASGVDLKECDEH